MPRPLHTPLSAASAGPAAGARARFLTKRAAAARARATQGPAAPPAMVRARPSLPRTARTPPKRRSSGRRGACPWHRALRSSGPRRCWGLSQRKAPSPTRDESAAPRWLRASRHGLQRPGTMEGWMRPRCRPPSTCSRCRRLTAHRRSPAAAVRPAATRRLCRAWAAGLGRGWATRRLRRAHPRPEAASATPEARPAQVVTATTHQRAGSPPLTAGTVLTEQRTLGTVRTRLGGPGSRAPA
jgi:hypothetical protein